MHAFIRTTVLLNHDDVTGERGNLLTAPFPPPSLNCPPFRPLVHSSLTLPFLAFPYLYLAQRLSLSKFTIFLYVSLSFAIYH